MIMSLIAIGAALGCGEPAAENDGGAGAATDNGGGGGDVAGSTDAALDDGGGDLGAGGGDTGAGDASGDGVASTDCVGGDESCNGVDDDCDGATDEDSCDDAPCVVTSCKAKEGGHACVAAPAADGTLCDDGDPCMASDLCKGGICKGNKAACQDGDPCTQDACAAGSGACSHTAAPDGGVCDDGSACSQSDVCQAGKCKGAIVDCDDKNGCTVDTCDVKKGCQYEGVQGNCDDGDACTQGDTCVAETCIPGDPVACPAGSPCELSACDKSTGKCKTTLLKDGDACDDGAPCSVADVCAVGACLGKAKTCDDGSPCTIDACLEANGACSNAPTVGNTACDDSSKCTGDDKCDKGVCAGKKLACDDNSPCTEDTCEAATGCFGLPVPGSCEDGDACTSSDACKDGKCQPGSQKTCNDDNSCTVDACDPKTGICLSNPVPLEGKPCADKSLCTSGEACQAGACVAAADKDCGDDVPCTLDGCDADTGICTHKALPDGAPCSDGSLCTYADTCDAVGACSGKVIPCVDGLLCTIDGCDAKSGACTFAAMPKGASCDDNNKCSVSDSCDGKGKCDSGKVKVCDDDSACTDDTCNITTGNCAYNNNQLPCDDGNACLLNDACSEGSCKAESAGKVSTIAGATPSFADGALGVARFSALRGMSRGGGALHIADTGNHRIRQLKGKTISTMAGDGNAGYLDGGGAGARFSSPCDVAYVEGGALYIADRNNHAVRLLGSGQVSTAFGAPAAGLTEGKGIAARMNSPEGVGVAPDGALWVADTGNHAIRRVGSDGVLRVVAGGSAGYVDGGAGVARLNGPRDIAFDSAGVGYVADASNHRIRRILPDGTVTTLAGSGLTGLQDGVATSARLSAPTSLAVRADGGLLIADQGHHAVRLLAGGQVTTLAGTGTAGAANAVGGAATFYSPSGVEVAEDGAVLVGDLNNHQLRRIAPGALSCDDGKGCTVDACDAKKGCSNSQLDKGAACSDGNVCTTGDVCDAAGACKATLTSCDDGTPCTSDICNPIDGKCVTVSTSSVCEDGDACLGPDTCQNGVCKTQPGLESWVGSAAGFVDGKGKVAAMNSPTGACDDGVGGVFVADRSNHRIRQVGADGTVTTVAGSGAAGYTEGEASKAVFNTPQDVDAAIDGSLCVADRGNHRIRRIANGQVVLLAGQALNGFADGVGAAARFYYPEGVAVDPFSGDCYVADTYNNRIRKVSADGKAVTVAGDGASGFVEGKGVAARFYRPSGIDIDDKGFLYVADTYNHRVRRIDAEGNTTVLAGSGSATFADGKAGAASFNYPNDVSMGSDGTLLIADRNNHRLRELFGDGVVSTLAGSASAGAADGGVGVGQLNTPYGVVAHPMLGPVIVDYGNHRLRRFGYGKAKSCDDLDVCTTDNCDKASGDCSHAPIANCCQPVKQNYKFSDVADGSGWVFATCPASANAGAPVCTPYTPAADTNGWHVRPSSPVFQSEKGALFYGQDSANNFDFGASGGSAESPAWTVPAQGSSIEFAYWWDAENGNSYDRLHVSLLVDGKIQPVGEAAAPQYGAIFYKSQAGHLTPKVWVTVKQDVSAYVGKQVQVRFLFATGDSVANTGQGVYVDDFKYIAPCSK